MFAWPDRPPLRHHVAVVDYQMGNLFSIEQACAAVGLNAIITDEKAAIRCADAVILPGMGAFGDAMEHLHRLDLVEPLKDIAASGTALIGVCLGLQLMMEESEEFGSHKGLGIFEGSVRRLPAESPGAKVPQIGWNRIFAPSSTSWEQTPLRSVPQGAYVYFVHSYYVDPADTADVLAETEYGGFTYCSALRRGSIHAFQFHPERSGPTGLSIYAALAETLSQSNELEKSGS